MIRRRLEVLEGDRAVIWRIAAAPDGRTIATGDDQGRIRIWNLATGSSRLLVPDKLKHIQQLVFSPDGRQLAAASTESGEIYLWDVASGHLRGTLGGSAHRAVSALLFSKDGTRIAALGLQPGAGVRDVELWDLRSPLATFPILDPGHDPSTAAKVADIRLRSLADMIDDRPPSWSGSLAELNRSWTEHPPRAIARTQDQTLGLIAQGDGTFDVYSLACRLRVATGRIHARGCALVLFDDDLIGRFVPPAERAAIDRLAAKLVPHAIGKPLPPSVVIRLGSRDHAAAFSADGGRLAVPNADEHEKLKVIDLATGVECFALAMGRGTEPRSISFTPDGASLAFSGKAGEFQVWHLRSASNPIVLRGHAPKETWSLDFSPDGQTLASAGDDHCIRLWDLETGNERAVLRGHGSLVTSIAFTSDGRTMASASFDRKTPVILWDAATGTVRTVLKGHTGRARTVSFSQNGRTLASGAEDHSVIVWDVPGGRRVAEILHDSSQGHRAVLSPDGHMLASTEVDQIMLTDLVGGARRSIHADTEVGPMVFCATDHILRRAISTDRSTPGRRPRAAKRKRFPGIPASSLAWRFRPTAARSRPRARTGPCGFGIP